MRLSLLLLAVPLLLAGCGKTEREVHAELDADFAKGQVLLSCKSSSSGACHAMFLVDGELVTAQAATGATTGVNGISEGATYCVDVRAPDPTKCKPKPLVPGKQIVRSSTVRS